MDKLLRINMSVEGGPNASVDQMGEYAGLAGRALTSAVVAREVPPLAHPLSEDNKLVIAPGMLSGSLAAMSGRMSVGCKSPLTGGSRRPTRAARPPRSWPGSAMPRSSWRESRDSDLYRIFINKDGVNIIRTTAERARNYDLVEK